jgi:hypothetical protein
VKDEIGRYVAQQAQDALVVDLRKQAKIERTAAAPTMPAMPDMPDMPAGHP